MLTPNTASRAHAAADARIGCGIWRQLKNNQAGRCRDGERRPEQLALDGEALGVSMAP
jgi:hypothetical protein